MNPRSQHDRVITTVALRYENDVVLARQRARQIAGLLGFDNRDQVRAATAVSEIARNAFRYAGGGSVDYLICLDPAVYRVRVRDQGPGIPNLEEILDGKYVSRTGMGMGILGARRLMDDFRIETAPGAGTSVLLEKALPRNSPVLASHGMARLSAQLAALAPQDPFEEMQRQNQELLATLQELQRRQSELAQLNRELEDTNRGVVALYAELDERADYLRRASELKSQFLSNMTHEFRTPLNSILSLSRILLDRLDGELSIEQERQVMFIQKAAQDLSELVNDLLDLAKVEAGKVILRPQEFDVRDLFGALKGMLRPLLAHNTAVSLVFEAPSDIPSVFSDESKVSQVLRNLISNALKYTERGEVRVRARSASPERVRFEVIDTGVGIDPADQERIFEEFTQVEGEHQKGKRGTGLGLPLSRKLAGLLGGDLTLKSQLGQGSTFTLDIPVRYTGPQEVSVAPPLPPERDPNRLPVLVIEDNPETLFVYEKFLKGTGFQAIPARSLDEARRILEALQPAAVLLDILLAHENTWDFLAKFKRDPATRKIPVFVVTMVENEHKAIALGADGFHTKPLDRRWLLRHLRAIHSQNDPEEVLIIDDDEPSRYILAGLLSGTRFRPIEAADGPTGLALARERQPAAIFLDLRMPGMTGFQVLAALKESAGTRSIPVVIHTSKQLSRAERTRLERHAVAIIEKDHQDRQASGRRIMEALSRAGAAGREGTPSPRGTPSPAPAPGSPASPAKTL